MNRVATIKSQLVKTKLVVAMAVLTLCSSAYITNDVLLFRKHLIKNTQSIAELIALNVAPTLAFNDNAEGNRILGSLFRLESISSAVLLSADGNTFAKYANPAASQSTGPHNSANLDLRSRQPTSHFTATGLVYAYPIFQDSSEASERLGTLLLEANLQVLKQEYKRYSYIVLAILLCGFLLAFMFASYAQALFTRPLLSLLGTVMKVSSSGDYSARVTTPDSKIETQEFVALTREFNQMIKHIADRDKAILTANETLEQKVDERTKQLKEMQQGVVQSSRLSAIGEMASGIAHEINNPLQIIYGKAITLKSKIQKGTTPPEVLLQEVETISKTAMRIAKIISGLRTFSRDGKRDPFESSQLSTIIADTLELCAAKFRSHGVDLRLCEIPESLQLYCRATELGQVLLNLLNNAYDAIQPLPEKWISIHVVESESYLEIHIVDSGAGIPAPIRDKILQPFFTTKEVGKGTGLGLSISKGIIESHHGTLTIDTTNPHTAFVLRLPKDPRQFESAGKVAA